MILVCEVQHHMGVVTFFGSNEQLGNFLQMMYRTGAIVSRSTTLQLFERTYYEESDLDLYVNVDRWQEVYHWLSEAGFQRMDQDKTRQNRTWCLETVILLLTRLKKLKDTQHYSHLKLFNLLSPRIPLF